MKVDNLSNDGVIIANGSINAKNVKNIKDITAVGTVSSDDLITSGNVRANGKITVSGKLENSGAVETSKNISVAGNIKNDGRIAANDDLAGKNTENNGNIYVKNLEVNSLRNTGKVEGVNLKTDDIANSRDITAIGKISSGNIDNSGKLLANDTISAKNIKNATSSSKIAAGKGITGERIENSGIFATNGDIKATSSLVNSGTVDDCGTGADQWHPDRTGGHGSDPGARPHRGHPSSVGRSPGGPLRGARGLVRRLRGARRRGLAGMRRPPMGEPGRDQR